MDDWKNPFYRYHTIYVKALLASFRKDILDHFGHVEQINIVWTLLHFLLVLDIAFTYALEYALLAKIKRGEMR
ncbi:MAG TPA: hypothetical protein DDW34_00100 [Clostridium sp.]|nr:hypothetical protein [Clostridium sp.]